MEWEQNMAIEIALPHPAADTAWLLEFGALSEN